MNDNIDKAEIRMAIDRLQTEHPRSIAYDPTTFANMEAANVTKECIDKIARRMMEDTEIHIICEFAKLYLEGVRPMAMSKQEWIPCSERLPSSDGKYLINYHSPRGNNRIQIQNFMNGDWYPNFGKSYITAWMPLPEPYREGEQNVL